ncbi:MAG TPA: hypothetical protein VGX21_21240 [Methylomirabilota bacterium]|jgi:hypothetical protein|nr:hypothetical protein [Methylomirabilota bacterium]
MKLVVSQDGTVERGGSRVVLRLIQGGAADQAQRRLLAPPTSARSQTPPAAAPAVDVEDIPLYLRPIPARLPRLW